MKKFVFVPFAVAALFVFMIGVALAAPGIQAVWNQGFEQDTSGWFDLNSGWYGDMTRVSSGTNGIASAAGSWHAIASGDADSAPFSRFDGYRDTWPGTWTAEIDVYLDPSWAAGTGFDYSVAASGSDGGHQRDFPHGSETPGIPARFAPIVKMSFRYIASGSLFNSPTENAGVGAAGVSTKSTLENA